MPAKCFDVEHHESPDKALIIDGDLTLQMHQVGFVLSALFAIIACLISFWLISKHLMYYNEPRQQRYIVRILFMVPVYAIVSWLSYFFWI